MTYRWRDWSFATPTGWVDQTFVVFVDDRPGQQMSATITVDKLTQPLSSYVDEVVREVAARVKSARLQERIDAQVDGRPAIVVEQLIKPNSGPPTLQRQAFVHDGDEVVIVSVTSDAEATTRVRACLTELSSSLRKSSPVEVSP